MKKSIVVLILLFITFKNNVSAEIPTVTLNANPYSGAPPLRVNFTADAIDSDGTITKYEWDFDGDGIYTDTTSDSTNSYFYNKNYEIFYPKVRVTDNDDNTAEDSTVIAVYDILPRPVINSPIAGSKLNNTRPSLVVNSIQSLNYFFMVSTDSTFSPIFDSGIVTAVGFTCSWTATKDCVKGVKYWWTCMSSFTDGKTVITSGRMSPVSFSIGDTDNTAPTIDTIGFGILNNGRDSVIKIVATDKIGLSKGEFWIKKNGENDNNFQLIFSESGGRFVDTTVVRDVVIPAKYVTQRGVSYRIKITDLAGNIAENNGYLHVKVTDYIVPFPTWTWEMISFPLILKDNNVNSALGPLENRRVYRWNPLNKEYSNIYDTTIEPGDAFWFKIKEDNDKIFDSVLVNGISVDPGNVPEISLPPGWSQIANPYFYKIVSSRIKIKQDTTEFYVSDTTNNNLVKYDFQTYGYITTTVDNNIQIKKGYFPLETIEPFIGFWVKNISDKVATVIFPKFDVDATGIMASPSHKVKNDGWGLKLKVMNKNYIDTDNYLGFLPGAKNGNDFYDLFEPPPVENYVSLYFPHSDWGKDNGRYRTDYRTCGNYGALEITNYDFVIETNIKDKTTLSWDIINPPLNYRVTLYDKKEDKKIDIASIKDYVIDWSNGDSKRDFSIIVEWDNIYLLNSIEISDLNLNRIIDGEDLSIFGSTFGKMQGENNWDSKTDLNKDKIIDGSDLFILGNNFGKHY